MLNISKFTVHLNLKQSLGGKYSINVGNVYETFSKFISVYFFLSKILVNDFS